MFASCDSDAYSLRSNQVISARNVQASRRCSCSMRLRGSDAAVGGRRAQGAAPRAKSSASAPQHLVGEELVDVVLDLLFVGARVQPVRRPSRTRPPAAWICAAVGRILAWLWVSYFSRACGESLPGVR